MSVVSDYFDALGPTWDETAEPSGVKNIAVAYAAGVREGSRVLDLGCGTGIMAPAYLTCGAAEVVALDVAQGMVDAARAKFADEARVRFECCDVLDYDDDRPFDVVVVYNAYPHFMDKRALAEKVASLLRDGGRFLVAHGASRDAINAHHGAVPADVRCTLESAAASARDWEGLFAIDTMVDAGHFYCFGGVKKAAAQG